MLLVGSSTIVALCTCSSINSVDLQPKCFFLQVYREPVQELLHPTGETLRPSSAISTENWKPKDLVRVQERLSECSSTWPRIQMAFFLSFSPICLVFIYVNITATTPWYGVFTERRKEEGKMLGSWEERRKEVKKLEGRQKGKGRERQAREKEE